MHDKTTFYGTATVGTKGQIVIPAEAREELKIKEGDKVTVKLIAVDDRGRLQLSMKAAARELSGQGGVKA